MPFLICPLILGFIALATLFKYEHIIELLPETIKKMWKKQQYMKNTQMAYYFFFKYHLIFYSFHNVKMSLIVIII